MRNVRTYIKNGDFSKTIDNGSNINWKVKYINKSDKPKLVKFEILGYKSSDNIQCVLTFSNQLAFENFIQNCSSSVKGINSSNSKLDFDFLKVFDRYFNTDNRDLLKELILTMHKFDPLDEETKKELMLGLGITKPILFEDVVALIQSKNFDAALSLAIEDDNPDTLWNLGKYCESNLQNDPQKAIACYKLIPCENPHFEEANEILFHALLTLDPGNLSLENKLNLLESKFTVALKSGENNGNLTAQLFHELCGYTDLCPKNKTIKGDAETLIALAQQIRALVKENHALMHEVQNLRSIASEKKIFRAEEEEISKPERAESPKKMRSEEGKPDVKPSAMISPASPGLFRSVSPSRDSLENDSKELDMNL